MIALSRSVTRIAWFTALLLCIASTPLPVAGSQPDEPVETLRTERPTLFRLYNAYPAYRERLRTYAIRQGFRFPFELLATQTHELIHIDSYIHQGYFVEGIYYEPYLRAGAWPSLSNKEISGHIPVADQGDIYRLYVRNAPTNHLGNVVDEINAYGHVIPFVCAHEPMRAGKQVKNLLEFLALSEWYLRVLRTRLPTEYAKLGPTSEAGGILILVVQRAWRALQLCDVAPAAIQSREAMYLMSQRG